MTLIQRILQSVSEIESIPEHEREAWDKAHPEFRQDVNDLLSVLIALGDKGDMHVRGVLAQVAEKLQDEWNER